MHGVVVDFDCSADRSDRSEACRPTMADTPIQVDYEHAPELVWRALAESTLLARWLMPNDIVARAGHRFHFRTKPLPGFDGTVACEVLEAIPGRRLSYSLAAAGVATTITWTLDATDTGTRLTFAHAGFRGLRGLLIRNILGDAWISQLLHGPLKELLRTEAAAGKPARRPAKPASKSREGARRGTAAKDHRAAAARRSKPG